VETRLGKVERGEIDATLLAYAGLKRLGFAHRATALLDIDAFLPAVGQGAIGLTARTDDAIANAALTPILDAETDYAVTTERAFLRVLDGSCRTPIAGHAQIVAGAIHFRGMVLSVDGSEANEIRGRGSMEEAAFLGEATGRELLSRSPATTIF
jgi:hydroxymethylbilane synthase